MNKTVAIFFLITILLQCTSKLWIMASFYIQQDYIAQNLCINRFDAIPVCKGQCYLKKQLKTNENQEKKISDLKEKEIQFYSPKCFVFEFKKSIITDTLCSVIHNDNLLCSEFLFSVFHPPRTS